MTLYCRTCLGTNIDKFNRCRNIRCKAFGFKQKPHTEEELERMRLEAKMMRQSTQAELALRAAMASPYSLPPHDTTDYPSDPISILLSWLGP